MGVWVAFVAWVLASSIKAAMQRSHEVLWGQLRTISDRTESIQASLTRLERTVEELNSRLPTEDEAEDLGYIPKL
jgi:hypothetical protein